MKFDFWQTSWEYAHGSSYDVLQFGVNQSPRPPSLHRLHWFYCMIILNINEAALTNMGK